MQDLLELGFPASGTRIPKAATSEDFFDITCHSLLWVGSVHSAFFFFFFELLLVAATGVDDREAKNVCLE